MTDERRVEVAAEALRADGWTCEYHEPTARRGECSGCDATLDASARAVVAALDAHDNRVLADLLVARYGKERTLAWLRPDDGAPPLTQFEALCRVAEGAALDAHDGDLRERLAGAVEALPPENATGSRDFGRGYASATRDAARIIRERP